MQWKKRAMQQPNNDRKKKLDGPLAAMLQAATPLSIEAEAELVQRWIQSKDEEARHRLVGAHMLLVVAIAKRFRRNKVTMDDLIQEGALGLLRAADRFDPAHNVRFSSYAIWWVRAAMTEYIFRNALTVRPGGSTLKRTLFFRIARIKARARLESHTPDEEREIIAKEASTSVKAVEEIEMHLNGGDISLNASIGSASGVQVQDTIRADTPTPEEAVADSEEAAWRQRHLADAVLGLSDRERQVVRERYLREDRLTLEDVALQIGISKERVRQIETRAVKKLGRYMQNHLAA
jgi:RNA polymerase sigma-32 factor